MEAAAAAERVLLLVLPLQLLPWARKLCHQQHEAAAAHHQAALLLPLLLPAAVLLPAVLPVGVQTAAGGPSVVAAPLQAAVLQLQQPVAAFPVQLPKLQQQVHPFVDEVAVPLRLCVPAPAGGVAGEPEQQALQLVLAAAAAAAAALQQQQNW